MPVEAIDLGIALCRATMRDMCSQPIMPELANFGLASFDATVTKVCYDYELTPAARQTVFGQFCVVLLPLPDCISVRAHLKFRGLGFYDRAVLSPDNGLFKDLIFVRYPADHTLITGPDYESDLRIAIGKGLAAIDNAKPAKEENSA